MQFMIVPVLLAILIALLRGGQLKNLGSLIMKHTWLPLAMFVLQLGIVLFPQDQSGFLFDLRPWITVATYLLLIAFLGVNRKLPGIKLVLVGAALNLAVILANGGYMPVTREALARSGHLDKIYVDGERAFVLGSKDVVLSDDETRLLPLSDVLKVPGVFEVPATFSVGDVFIMIGAAWLAFRTVKTSPEVSRLDAAIRVEGLARRADRLERRNEF